MKLKRLLNYQLIEHEPSISDKTLKLNFFNEVPESTVNACTIN